MLSLTAAALIYASFTLPCLIAVLFDIRSRRIPNACVVALASGALLQMLLDALGALPADLVLAPYGERLAWSAAVAAGGFGLEVAWRHLHGGAHGMGFGDIKLFSAMALWLGAGVLWAVLLACLLALAVELPRKSRAFAFGPYIVAASAVCLVMPAVL